MNHLIVNPPAPFGGTPPQGGARRAGVTPPGRFFFLIALFGCLLCLPACGGGGGTEDGDADAGETEGDDTPTSGYRCVRDPGLIDAPRACSYDEDCPCGTHCADGLCVHACVKDSECAGGGRCDFFGRCRAAGDDGLVPPVATSGGSGALRVEPGAIDWQDWSPERVALVRAVSGDLADVRVAAGRGLLVSCGEGFSGECSIASVREGETAPVALKLDPSVERPALMRLEVRHALQVRTVTVEAGQAPVFTDPLPGVYRGQILVNGAWAMLAGNRSAEELPVSTGSALLQVGVTLTLFDDGTLVLEDALGLLPQSMVFTLGEGGRFDALDEGEDLSRQVYIGGAESADDETATEVSVSTAGELRAVGEAISGSLTMTVDGLGLAVVPSMLVDERVRLGWQFHVVRAGDIPEDEDPPAPGGGADPAFSTTQDRYGDVLPWEAAVAGCGSLGGTDVAGKVERYLCYAHPGTLSSVPLKIDSGNLTLLGDLKCDDTQFRRTAFPLLTNGDNPSGGLQAQAALSSCTTELDRLATAAQSTTYPGAQGIDFLSGCGGDYCQPEEIPACIDGPVALRALGLATESMPREGWPDRIFWRVSSPYAVRLAHRLVQEWIQTHTFVAREQAQSADFLFGGTGQDVEAGLRTSLGGWDIVLHPRVAGWMLHLPADILGEPDYRGLDPDPARMTEDITQAVGLPVVILEGLRSQLEAALVIVSRARFEGTSVSPQVGRALRYSAVLVPLAELIHARASLDGAPPWEGRWLEAVENTGKALVKLLAETKAHAAGINPLGITDEDLPLYHGSSNPADAGERFSAISSYLLDNWAASAVASAAAARDAAVSAYGAMLDRQLQKEMLADRPDRVAEIKRLYGEKILTMCGNPYGYTADEVLDEWTDVSADNCFMNPANASCRFDEEELLAKLTVDDVAYQLCYLTELRLRLGDRAQLTDDSLNELIGQLTGDVAGVYDAGSGEFWHRLDFTGFYDVGVNVYESIVGTFGGPTVSDLDGFRNLQISGDEDADALVEAESICRAQVPGGVPPAELVAGLESSPLDRPECYQGSIGELALAARDASKDIEVANSALQDSMDAYQNRLNACFIEEKGLATLAAAEEQVAALEAKVQAAQGTIDGVLGVVNTVFNSLTFGLGADGPCVYFNPGEVSTLITGWIGETTSAALGIEEMAALHEQFVADFQDRMERAQCFNDAEMQLVATDTQARRIEASKLDLAQAMLKLSNARQELARLIVEGRRRVEGEKTRQNMSLVNDIWGDLYALEQDDAKGKIEAYRRSMRLAQLAVYLAVRAVEYEFQMTHTARGDVLEATEPADLLAVVNRLKAEAGTVKIAGQSPEGLHVVLSIKDNLMQLADMKEWPDGEHKVSASERFRMLLGSPKYAYYDAAGVYKGQLIPFSLAPLGALGLGDPGTIGLLTGSDCAERTWSVNLVIQGRNLVDDGATYTRVDLLQRNTFYSQWCAEPGEGQGPMQSVSVRPSHNLLRDPVWGAEYGQTDSTRSDYTRTRIEAYFNKTRAELEAEDYQQGAKEELATRALYGEYALFFPADYLATDKSATGLHLDRIDDILLRFDYVSAAKTW